MFIREQLQQMIRYLSGGRRGSSGRSGDQYLATERSQMSVLGAYTYSKALLDRDYTAFEAIVFGLVQRYGKDYDAFLRVIEKNIHLFQRKKDYIHNTLADALLTYLFARFELDMSQESRIKFVEFSPMWGWSTCLLLRAIKDSGKEKQVELWSYELSPQFARKAKRNLEKLSDHIAIESLRLENSDALKEVKLKHADGSIDFLLIDCDHSRRFTERYLYEVRIFDKCRDDTIVHIHDFKFWLDGSAPEKWQEPEVLADFFRDNEDWVNQRYLGQVFMLLGGSPDMAEMVTARRATPASKYFSADHNFFIRHGLPQQYWLGGTIANTNHPFSGSGQKGKTYLCGLALWIMPKTKFADLVR